MHQGWGSGLRSGCWGHKSNNLGVLARFELLPLLCGEKAASSLPHGKDARSDSSSLLPASILNISDIKTDPAINGNQGGKIASLETERHSPRCLRGSMKQVTSQGNYLQMSSPRGLWPSLSFLWISLPRGQECLHHGYFQYRTDNNLTSVLKDGGSRLPTTGVRINTC